MSDSEKPKEKTEVCLKGVSKYHKDKQVGKELQSLLGDAMIPYVSITKPMMKPYCFVKFNTEDERDRFIQLINDIPPQKNKRLRIGDVYFSTKFAQKQQRDQQQQQQPRNRRDEELVDQEPVVKRIFTMKDVVNQTAPLNQLSYEQQLNYKQNELVKVLNSFRKQYMHRLQDEKAPKWIESDDINQWCNIEDPVGCDEPHRLHYRNKSEFTIGLNQNGEPCVGFNVGSHTDKSACVEKGNECVVTPVVALKVADLMEEIVRKSGLPPFNRNTGEGFWKLITLRRSTRSSQAYVVVTVNKSFVEEEKFQETVTLLSKDLQEFFSSDDHFLKGITIIHSSKRSSDYPDSKDDVYLAFGDPYYTEIIMGKEFQISYNGFLQNHIEQCDKLYGKIIEYVKASKPTLYKEDPIFLDVCAGSGTIGIILAESVKEVIAIEMVESSCKDAQENYEKFGLKNCKIICSKVEDVMKQLSNDLKSKPNGSHFVACLDPPRAGVNNNVIEALRTCKGLDNIVYVSCSPPQIIENLLNLCLPQNKRRRAPGFKLKSVVMVDMFPQTSHYEALFHLERDYDL